jgi:ParB family chromosome partitioning protein
MRDYIASATGKSTGKINQINSINNNLCEEGKEAFKDGKINFSTAYETSRLPEEKQHEVIENGELLSKDVREMVKEEREKKEAEKKPGDDYEPAHPESITSLCYSCLYYSECNVKTGTCEKCDKYTNKAEAEKTEEQRYDEEQAAIDRDTKAKLRQQSDNKKMETLPSEAVAAEPKTHIIRLAAMYFDDVASGKKSFELRKNDRGYKEGDVLELMEFKDGRNTGREIKADIIYMLEDYSGLEEGWCILGIKVRPEEKKGS